MKRFTVYAWTVLLVLAATVTALAQGPAPAPPCAQQLNNEMLNKGGALSQLGLTTQQLAVTRDQLDKVTAELAETKAALAKATPKPAEEKK